MKKNKEQVMDDFGKFLRAVMPVSENLKPGESVTTECPYCHSVLHVSRNDYNEHVFVYCDGCDAKLMS